MTNNGGWSTDTLYVSIHTLTRRVTPMMDEYLEMLDVSIHTLTRRVTKKFPMYAGISSVSIHTLTRRVTLGSR